MKYKIREIFATNNHKESAVVSAKVIRKCHEFNATISDDRYKIDSVNFNIIREDGWWQFLTYHSACLDKDKLANLSVTLIEGKPLITSPIELSEDYADNIKRNFIENFCEVDHD